MRETQDYTWPGVGAALLSFAPGQARDVFFLWRIAGTALLWRYLQAIFSPCISGRTCERGVLWRSSVNIDNREGDGEDC